MAFQLLNFRQSGALVKRQPMHLFTMVASFYDATPQRFPLGIPRNIARKTALKHKHAGEEAKRLSRTGNWSFRQRPVRMLLLGFVTTCCVGFEVSEELLLG